MITAGPSQWYTEVTRVSTGPAHLHQLPVRVLRRAGSAEGRLKPDCREQCRRPVIARQILSAPPFVCYNIATTKPNPSRGGDGKPWTSAVKPRRPPGCRKSPRMTPSSAWKKAFLAKRAPPRYSAFFFLRASMLCPSAGVGKLLLSSVLDQHGVISTNKKARALPQASTAVSCSAEQEKSQTGSV